MNLKKYCNRKKCEAPDWCFTCLQGNLKESLREIAELRQMALDVIDVPMNHVNRENIITERAMMMGEAIKAKEQLL